MRLFRELLAWAALLAVLALLWTEWRSLPGEIPSHFGLSGAPNHFSGKSSLLMLPVVSFLLYGLLIVTALSPRILNYPIVVNDKNQAQLQSLALALIGWLKAEVLWIFVWLTWIAVRTAEGRMHGVPRSFSGASLGVIGVTILFFVVRMRRAG